MALNLTKIKACARRMANSDTGRSVKSAACAALYVGAFLGSAMVVVSASKTLTRVVFGNDD